VLFTSCAMSAAARWCLLRIGQACSERRDYADGAAVEQ
jgi:hypothetical protein